VVQRHKLIAVLGGLAVLAGAVFVLRNETPPSPAKSTEPVNLTRFVDEQVDYRAEQQSLAAPSDLKLTALDVTSLRAGWTPTVGYGYEVRWLDQVRYVLVAETELTGLSANDEITVEVRAVDAEGHRSAPSSATAVPRLLYDVSWTDTLVSPIDHFDGPESLSPHRWRALAEQDCLGLRKLDGVKRLEITCDNAELQSNMALHLAEPGADGAIGRVLLTIDGPGTDPNGYNQEVSVSLLPEPYDDLPWLGMYDPMAEPTRLPPGVVIMHISPFGASFSQGSDVPVTQRVVPVSGRSLVPSTGVRHRWELRILPDALVALRDGEVMAAAPAAVPWKSARPRLGFRNAKGTTLDSMGVGGQAENPQSTSVVKLGQSTRQANATEWGNVSSDLFAGATMVRMVATVSANNNAAVTMHFGGREMPAQPMYPWGTLGPNFPTVVYADFLLPDAAVGQMPKVRLTSTTDVDALAAQLVVRDGPGASSRRLPRLTDLGSHGLRVTQPALSIIHENNTSPPTQLPNTGKVRLVLQLQAGSDHAVAPTAGIEIDLDDKRVVTLPTNADGPAAGGRYEFWLDAANLKPGGHRVVVRVRPQDPKLAIRDTQPVFEIRSR
jgi:hypothetical protein